MRFRGSITKRANFERKFPPNISFWFRYSKSIQKTFGILYLKVYTKIQDVQFQSFTDTSPFQAFIAELTDEADRIAYGTQENRTPSEREQVVLSFLASLDWLPLFQIREYLEAIHMIYKLRHVQRRRSFLHRGDEDDVRERTRSAASEEVRCVLCP